MKIHDRVTVYLDPLTVSDPEGAATIITTPKPEMYGEHHGTDEKGRPLFRCIVQFDDDDRCFRTISEKIE